MAQRLMRFMLKYGFLYALCAKCYNKKIVSSAYSLYIILQIFSISLFEKAPIYQLLN